MRSRHRPRWFNLALAAVLPLALLYAPLSHQSRTQGATAATDRTSLAQTDDDLSSLPSAFKGVAISAGIVPFVKIPTEADPKMPHAEARAEFPDTAFGTGYVVDPGLVARASIATSGGVRVPTEVACSVPGGRDKEEFSFGELKEWNGQIRIGGGAIKASCAEGPATVTSGYLYNLVFQTSPVSQGAEPPGQTAIIAVGFVSILSRSMLRSEGLAVDTVAELKDVNIGALGQVHFDSIRVEASALSSESSPASSTTRVTFAGIKVTNTNRTEDPPAAIADANSVLAPTGLSIRVGDKTETQAPDGTNAEARAVGLIIEGGRTSDENAALWGERRFSLALGLAHSISHLSPSLFADADDGIGGTFATQEPSFTAPDITSLEAPMAPTLPDAPRRAGLAAGTYTLGLDWSSFKIKPLTGNQAAAAWGGVGLVLGGIALLRRRLFPS